MAEAAGPIWTPSAERIAGAAITALIEQLGDRLGIDDAGVNRWAAEVIGEGLEACAKLIDGRPGPYCFGDQVTLADICLVPQLVNARRFGAQLDWPRLLEIEAACLALPAFRNASPEEQPDAE